MSAAVPNPELKARHRAMWASGDYPSMVETFLLPLGPRLVEALRHRGRDERAGCRRGDRQRIDSGGRARRARDGERSDARVARGWPAPGGVEGAGARLGPSGRGELAIRGRVVRRRDVVDRCDVRAPPPGCRRRAGPGLPSGRHDRDAELDARGHDRRAVPDDGSVCPVPSAWRAAAAAVGQRGSRARAVRQIGSTWRTLERDVLEITAFEHPRDYGEHFKARYGPTIAARANASSTGRETEFDDALDRFCDEWNRGTAEQAHFEKEYLLAVGTRA